MSQASDALSPSPSDDGNSRYKGGNGGVSEIKQMWVNLLSVLQDASALGGRTRVGALPRKESAAGSGAEPTHPKPQ